MPNNLMHQIKHCVSEEMILLQKVKQHPPIKFTPFNMQFSWGVNINSARLHMESWWHS